MKATKRTLHLILAIAISTAMIAVGCGQSGVSKTPDYQIVSGSSNSNSQSAIDTREPENYTATIVLKAETTGERSSALTPLSAEVARMGADRRVSFKL